MKPEIKKRLIRTVIFSALALIIGGGVGWYQASIQKARVVTHDAGSGGAQIAGLKIGGPFSLVDHTGKAVTEADYAGQYKFIYFGFTYCPAICPTELQKMSQILRSFEQNHPDAAGNIQPLFITIDPERDDVDAMKAYVSLFHERFVGLTGTRPQIDFVQKAYRVYATRIEDESLSDYTMDHSTFVYFMGPNDEALGLYRMKDTADFIYADIEKKMGLL